MNAYLNNNGSYNRYLKPYPIHDYLISQITFTDLQEHLAEVQENRKLSESTMINYKSLLVQTFKYTQFAYNFSHTISYDELTVKKDKITNKKKALSSEEIPEYLKRVHENLPKTYANAVKFQLLTGLRIGELRALQFSDVQGDKLTINKSVERHTNKICK